MLKNLKIFSVVAVAVLATACNRAGDFSIPVHLTEPPPVAAPVTGALASPATPGPASTLIEVAPGTYCPKTVLDSVKGRVAVWAKPGAHPYAGTPEKAIKGFQGVPAEVKRAWLEQVKSSSGRPYAFLQGDVACEMWYTGEKNGVPQDYNWRNVRVGSWVNALDAKNGAGVYETVHNGFIWRLKRPDVCDNWTYDIVKAKVAEVAPPPATSAPKAVAYTGMYNLYVQMIQLETIPTDPSGPGSLDGKSLAQRVEEIRSRESEETYAEEFGAISRDFHSVFLDLLEKGVIKGVPQKVEAKIAHPGNSNAWSPVAIEPSKRFPGRTHWWKEISRNDAAQEKSWYGVAEVTSPGCTVYYPRRGDLRTLQNPKQGAASELALSARRKAATGMNLWVIMKCSPR